MPEECWLGGMVSTWTSGVCRLDYLSFGRDRFGFGPLEENGGEAGFNSCSCGKYGCGTGGDGAFQAAPRNARERLDRHHVAASVSGITKAPAQLLPEPTVWENLLGRSEE